MSYNGSQEREAAPGCSVDNSPYRADERQARADALKAAATQYSGARMPTKMVDEFARYILTGEWDE